MPTTDESDRFTALPDEHVRSATVIVLIRQVVGF
jgi:hypothetical protein